MDFTHPLSCDVSQSQLNKFSKQEKRVAFSRNSVGHVENSSYMVGSKDLGLEFNLNSVDVQLPGIQTGTNSILAGARSPLNRNNSKATFYNLTKLKSIYVQPEKGPLFTKFERFGKKYD